MQEIIYKDNLAANVNEEIKYHKKYGNLQTKKILKKWLLMTLGISVITLVIAAFNRDIPIIGYLVIIAIISALGFFIQKSTVKKSIITICKLNYEHAIAKNSNKKIVLKENGIETLSPYTKAYVPYEDIEFVISDPIAFSIKIKGLEKLNVIEKCGQDPDTLFNFDNTFREKLGEKFIYEM